MFRVVSRATAKPSGGRTGRTLLVPDDLGQAIYRLPVSALHHGHPGASKPILRIDPLPYGSELWHGRVDTIVAGSSGRWTGTTRRPGRISWSLRAGVERRRLVYPR